MFLYNINQFMGLIGQGGLSLGALLGMGYRAMGREDSED
jgi:hypothetical protein